MAKNVTMAFEEDLLDRLRVHAAQHKTSVNAIFRKHAEDLLGIASNRQAARDRLLELSRQSETYDVANPVTVDDGNTLFSREETYSGRRFEWPRQD